MDSTIVEIKKEITALSEHISDTMRAEVSIIELLIEKGVFTREEFADKSDSLPKTL